MIKNSSLTDEEFIRLVHYKRAASPVIDELCSRLEDVLDDLPLDGPDDDCGQIAVDCPVCEANLCVVDRSDGWELEVKG